MKIIQVIPVFNLAGAETMCETLSRELVRMGEHVIVVSLYSTETPMHNVAASDCTAAVVCC